MFLRLCSGLCCLLAGGVIGGQAVSAAPVIRWEFGTEETSKLQAHGGVHRDVPGPRPPEFPDFESSNTGVKFDGRGARFTFPDPGADSPFDFKNGDAITIEAWVKIEDLQSNENQYIIGKGRTGSKDFARDNQNWALRIREADGKACISFLFATPPASGAAKSDSHWHRWTSTDGFSPRTGWHHVAAAYRFGEPESIRGWIDGSPLKGKWDMGGNTKAAPVVDDDAIWIASSQGGTPGNSFRGSLDGVAVHREILSNETMKGRFNRTGGPVVAKAAPEVVPDLGDLPLGQVLVTYHEGMPAHNRWLNDDETLPLETLRWQTTGFLLNRLPRRYDDWGIRDSWKAPVLMRLAADVQLPPGSHQFLLRARGLGRLWVNGKVAVRTKTISGSTDGHQPVTPIPPPPAPGGRIVGYEMQEAFGEAEVGSDGRCRVILETLVGGKNFRPEPGEVSVAVQTPDKQSYVILQPAQSPVAAVSLTDAAVEAALARTEESLTAFDAATRRAAAAGQDEFWKHRHKLGREWAGEQKTAAVAAGASHPIDAFLKSRIDQAVAASSRTPIEEARHFHSKILPILSTNCFRCHGEKENGSLRLNSREAALRAGDSEMPAVVPGKPAESELLRRIRSGDEGERMPPSGTPLKPEEISLLNDWIQAGAKWPAPPLSEEQVALAPTIGDEAFLRRAWLDTVGVPASEAEAKAFLADQSPDKRKKLIDRLLADERWADHQVAYWQDVLAENPNMLKPSLNNTGPFRWFLYESFVDNKPFDRLVTELILMRGSEREGGSAGFGLAADNDAPYAAKGNIIATAFLGIELQCARCHDSPFHSTTQKDLYSLAALLERKTVTVPATSTVPPAFFEKKARESLIKVTLQPKEPIPPQWPFAETTGCPDNEELARLMQKPTDTRERLAALVTAPQNTRFAQVVVNRVWRRLIGAGFVEPAHDWEGHVPSHPELLAWLAQDFVVHDYDLKHLIRRIMTSELYQREATGQNLTQSPELRFFAAPDRRRLAAEQVVDSLYSASGRPIEVEEITFDPDGRRPANSMISLGFPSRAWMFASLSNERDRPSLSLPRAQAVADVLEAFGWTGSRQSPRTDRERDPNVLQPGVLANSVVSGWITRASHRSELAELAVRAQSPESLIDSVFLRFLNRYPTTRERQPFVAALSRGFDARLVPAAEVREPEPLSVLGRVTWSNHLVSEANSIKIEMERRARVGDPADPRLRPEWREVYEDFVWSIINTREFVWLP